jgi:peptidoglycan/LPS O-acetylase OafA/YrhL
VTAVDGSGGAVRTSARTFRPDVQALRAIAVAGVVVYHLWPHVLQGGFAGVDVFFVISGYLITGQLLDELWRTGRISLSGFWARRIRRILPAALVVLAVCIVVTVWVVAPMARADSAEQIRASAAYAENWLLATRSAGDAAAGQLPSMVEHYWSLSVEEQFYLLWPLLLLLAVPATRLLRSARRPAVVGVLSLATVASFVMCLHWTAADAATAFYATPVRAWEFGVGGLVAALSRRAPVTRSSPVAVAVAAAGVVTIAVSYALLRHDDAFPGIVALLPVAGTVAVVAAGAAVADRRTAAVAGVRAVRWLGDHSYAVYLWHWPLIILARWTVLAASPVLVRWAVIPVTLVLAAATVRWVEEPVRRGQWWTGRRLPAYGLAVLGAGGLALVAWSLGTLANREQVSAAAVTRGVAVAPLQAPAREVLHELGHVSAQAGQQPGVLVGVDRVRFSVRLSPGSGCTVAPCRSRGSPHVEQADPGGVQPALLPCQSRSSDPWSALPAFARPREITYPTVSPTM